MATEVEICNMALASIRGGSIGSLTEASLQAQQCKLHYPVLRDMMLRDFPWSFARAKKPLALRSDLSVHNWLYVYQYPVDALYIDKIHLNITSISSDVNNFYRQRLINDIVPPDLESQVKFEVMNVGGEKVIVCNDADVRIEYRVKVTDTNLFDQGFTQALTHLLASHLAIPIAGGEIGRVMRADELKLYQSYLGAATANDKNEQYVEQPDSDFITIRS